MSPRANYPNDSRGGRDGAPGLDKTIDFNWNTFTVCILVGEWPLKPIQRKMGGGEVWMERGK